MMCMSRQECQEAALPVLAREYLQKGEAYFMEENTRHPGEEPI